MALGRRGADDLLNNLGRLHTAPSRNRQTSSENIISVHKNCVTPWPTLVPGYVKKLKRTAVCRNLPIENVPVAPEHGILSPPYHDYHRSSCKCVVVEPLAKLPLILFQTSLEEIWLSLTTHLSSDDYWIFHPYLYMMMPRPTAFHTTMANLQSTKRGIASCNIHTCRQKEALMVEFNHG